MYVVGIGPGHPQDRTRRAEAAIAASRVVVGYTRYVELIADLTRGKEIMASGMMHEVERCRLALQRAAAGETVALVSSGDPGIYGMAGLALELAAHDGLRVPIEIVPGVTAASAAAARLGAPLMVDFAVISLSDRLIPWKIIRRRVAAAAAADLVVALYNPRSHERIRQLDETVAILRRYRKPRTPVGVVTAAGTAQERIVHTDLAHVLACEIGMQSIVIVGNRSTRRIASAMVTPRGYPLSHQENKSPRSERAGQRACKVSMTGGKQTRSRHSGMATKGNPDRRIRCSRPALPGRLPSVTEALRA